MRFSLTYGTLSEEERQLLLAFFFQHGGKETPFWFHDWSERRLSGQFVTAADGLRTTYYLTRTYGYQKPYVRQEYVRNILPLLPFAGYGEDGYGGGGYGGTGWLDFTIDGYEPTVYVDGVETQVWWGTSGNYVTITFSAPPPFGAVITADYAQCRLVRFDCDLESQLWTVRVNKAQVILQEVLG